MEFEKLIDNLKAKKTLQQIFHAVVSNDNKIASEWSTNGKIAQITYRQYKEKVIRTAFKLKTTIGAKNYRRFIGLQLDTCPEWPIFFWALLMAGFRPILIDPKITDHLRDHIIDESKLIALISPDEKNKSLKVKHLSLNWLLNDIGLEPPPRWKPKWADEVALCTSGTTATSKIYVYTGSALALQVLNFESASRENFRLSAKRDMRVLAFLPFHHIFGFTGVYLWHSFIGKTIIYLENKAPTTIKETCLKHRVTHLLTVPVLLNGLAKAIRQKASRGTVKKALFHSLLTTGRYLQKVFPDQGSKIAFKKLFGPVMKEILGPDLECIMCGGGHVLPETLKQLSSMGFFIVCGFGMTEVGITSLETSSNLKIRLSESLGKAFPSVEYAILPTDHELNEGVGELYIRGKSLHSWRLKKGELVKPDIDKKGWLKTGDVASIENGRLFIRGRIKDVIINESGENVYPDEIEDYFGGIPHISDYSVLGIKKTSAYEDITLVLYSESLDLDNFDEKKLSEISNIVFKIKDRMPISKSVAKILISAKPLPKANQIKVQRQKLKREIESGAWPTFPLARDKIDGNTSRMISTKRGK
ncbi:MAG: acyl--CoA ligase [Candidatus Riflebacteria bacterium]|nr:acyl--CoA ligase [Candidatus Riflebacteria bacterium]